MRDRPVSNNFILINAHCVSMHTSLVEVSCLIIIAVLTGAEAAAKMWRGLINMVLTVCTFRICCATCHGNINSCRSSPCHQFARVCVRTHIPYRAARMLNQLRRGHRAWPMFELKSGAAMAAPAAPMPAALDLICVHVLKFALVIFGFHISSSFTYPVWSRSCSVWISEGPL